MSSAALAEREGDPICELCGVPLTGDHIVNDCQHRIRWWSRAAVRHLRAARICIEPHAGKPCRKWHLEQAVQARGYARELRRRLALQST